MAPGLFWRDSMECCFLGWQLDIGHPAGSPGYSLLAKALSFLPLGSIAWRANLLCVLGAWAAAILTWFAMARWLVYLKLAEPRTAWLLAAGPALAFAFSESFWAWSATAKVYSLRAAGVAGLLWLAAVAFREKLADARWAATAGLLLGVAGSAHIVFALYAPAFGLTMILGPGRRIRWRDGVLMTAFFFVGFSIYAYLPARALHGLPYDQGNPQTLPAFLAHITGSYYSHIIHRFPWERIAHNLRLVANWIPREIDPLLTLAAVVGALAVARRAPRALALTALIAAGHLYLYIKDWAHAFGYVTIFQLCALLAAVGVAAGWRRLARGQADAPRAAARAGLAIFAAALGAWGAVGHWPVCHRGDHDLAQRHGAGVLASLPLNAILVGHYDWTAHNMFFQQLVEKQRPDVEYVQREWLPYPEELASRFPSWKLGGYDPAAAYGAQKMLLANDRGGGVFWDLGSEDRPFVEPANLTPHGAVYRLGAAPWDGRETADDRRLWRDVFGPILASPLVAPRGYDWTAADVYAHILQTRAETHAVGGRWADAERDAAAAIAAEPDFASFTAFYGKLRLAQDDPAGAAAKFDEALRLDPFCGECWAMRASLSARQGDRARALAEFARARRLQSLEAHDALVDLRLLWETRNYGEILAVIADTERGPLDTTLAAGLDELAAAVYAQRGQCEAMQQRLARLRVLAPADPALGSLPPTCGENQRNRLKSAPDERH